MSTAVVASLLEKTKDFSIEETLSFLANEYPNQVVFSTSFGQEDQVITDFIGQNQLPITVFTLDTGPTDRIWEIARKIKNLKAIFTEVSFPNSLEKVAEVSDHHTANSLKFEMKKMPELIPVILTHLKPSYRDIILKEIQEMKEDRIRVLNRDGEIFNF
jgi:3'-phosphoadenosine 5'-phosphosulfate sulfotransferase (PAPS reductase)/FAD synthetase